jgi:hypothetical protein
MTVAVAFELRCGGDGVCSDRGDGGAGDGEGGGDLSADFANSGQEAQRMELSPYPPGSQLVRQPS